MTERMLKRAGIDWKMNEAKQCILFILPSPFEGIFTKMPLSEQNTTQIEQNTTLSRTPPKIQFFKKESVYTSARYTQ